MSLLFRRTGRASADAEGSASDLLDAEKENESETEEEAPEAEVSGTEASEAEIEASGTEASEASGKAGRKLLAVGLTLATAASLFFAGLSESPGELAYKKETAAPVVISAPVNPADDDEDRPDENSQEEKLHKSRSLKAFFSEWLLRMPAAFKWLLALPLWAVGSLILSLAKRLLKLGLSPLLALMGKWLLLGLLLFGLLYLLLKLIFPDLKLRELLNLPTLLTLWGGSLALVLLGGTLDKLWDAFSSFEYLFDFIGGLIVLLAAAAPILRRRRKQKREAA